MNKYFNKHENIDAYFGEPCVYAAWNEGCATEFNLLSLDGDYAGGYGNICIYDDEISDWQPCELDEDTIEEIKDWFRRTRDEDAEEDDFTSKDVDDAIAFFRNIDDEQFILVLNR